MTLEELSSLFPRRQYQVEITLGNLFLLFLCEAFNLNGTRSIKSYKYRYHEVIVLSLSLRGSIGKASAAVNHYNKPRIPQSLYLFTLCEALNLNVTLEELEFLISPKLFQRSNNSVKSSKSLNLLNPTLSIPRSKNITSLESFLFLSLRGFKSQ